jgi:HEAT repeat protein
MDELNSNVTPLPPDEDLTEVRKPATLLVAQFFLFPLIIIGICVGIFLFFGYLFFGSAEQKTPERYLEQMRSGTGTQRWQAAYELSNLVKSNPTRAKTPQFVENLANTYKGTSDEDILVRSFIAQIFGEFKEPSAVPLLAEGLRRDERLKTKKWEVGVLMGWFQPSVTQINEELLQAQIYTLWALRSIGDNSAVPVVLEFGKNREASVRKVAAHVLGYLKDPSAIEDLKVLLNDSSEDVRWSAAFSLAQLHDGSGTELLMKLLDRNYVNSLPNLDGDQKALLMANAVTGLGMLKHEPAKEKIRAISESDEALAVRGVALDALKQY